MKSMQKKFTHVIFHELKILLYKIKKKNEWVHLRILLKFIDCNSYFYRGTRLVDYQATGSQAILVDFDVQAESLLCFLVTIVKLDVLLARCFCKKSRVHTCVDWTFVIRLIRRSGLYNGPCQKRGFIASRRWESVERGFAEYFKFSLQIFNKNNAVEIIWRALSAKSVETIWQALSNNVL